MISSNIVVLKFGGSVLHSSDDFARIKIEIEQLLSQGARVIAVVSAYFGVTELLIKEAQQRGLEPNTAAYAELIATGEFESARELTAYLRAKDISAQRLLPKDINFLATGSRQTAAPVSLDYDEIIESFYRSPVLIVPGFSAIDEHGDCVLLGRGGSDISAVFIANILGLSSVRLLKDVDGLYDRDPNKFDDAQRLTCVSYNTAIRVGGELIQPEAIEFAARRGIKIEIASIGRESFSSIGGNVGLDDLGNS